MSISFYLKLTLKGLQLACSLLHSHWIHLDYVAISAAAKYDEIKAQSWRNYKTLNTTSRAGLLDEAQLYPQPLPLDVERFK